MNTFLSRLNTVFAFTLTVLAALTFLCFLSTFFNTNQATVYLQTKKVLVKNVQDFGVSKDKNDLGFVTFDLQNNGLLNYNGMNTKYYFFDDGMGLKGNQNVSLYLSWNVIPNAGILPLITQENKFSFDFPGEYTVNRGDH
ncbi:Signal peptidase complex subunit 3 [Acropora cervicornis]|uniref:Signal peptidase complex subunit 3 n=1 Tax=Acropora cervicornis TaxID=6130 RepID=A0AAD9QLW9_ACRCE|nr:Signal peptidase complex subunit 3 [Acropora cervicornis]